MYKPQQLIKTSKIRRMKNYGDNWSELSKECVRLAGGRCAKCGEPAATAHHIVPLSRGGRNVQINLQCLCNVCHASKHKHLLSRLHK